MAYDPDNIFAKILRGEIPAEVIYEDDKTLSFLDVMPQTKGHALVIPKEPSENILTADPLIFEPLLTTAQRVARAAMQAFEADGVGLQQFNMPAAGQTVFHTHFHVLPRYEGVALKAHSGQMADANELAALGRAYRLVLRKND